jgi:hypothetical protein
VTWQVQFYNERSRLLARYGVQAPTPTEALALARSALRAEHQPAVSRRPRSLFEQARLVGGQDPDGWMLYRIVKE